MAKRSRLRAQEVERRRLILIVVITGTLFGIGVWGAGRWQPDIWERLSHFFAAKPGDGQLPREHIRGMIYDRNYQVLAVSYERVSVYINIREINDLAAVIEPLAGMLDVAVEELYRLVGEGSPRIWLARDISQEQEEAIIRQKLPGVYLHREYVRYYPEHESAAHLVGFVERDTGLAGIEHFLTRLETSYRLDNRSVDTLPLVAEGRPGIDGRHLVLTLDLKIQRILENYVAEAVQRQPDSRVGALVMDAATGALVGYAQLPSFDPNRFHTYPEQVLNDLFNETVAVPEPFKSYLREISLLESQPEQGEGAFFWSVVAEQRKLGVQLQLWDRLGATGREPYDFLGAASPLQQRVSFDLDGFMVRDYETVPVMQTPLQLLTAITRSVNGGIGVRPHVADRFVLRRNQSEYVLEQFERTAKTGLLRKGFSAECRRLFAAMGDAAPLDGALLGGASTSYRMNGGMDDFLRHYLSIALVPAHEPELVLMTVGTSPGFLVAPKTGGDPTGEAASLVAPVVALQRVMQNLADMMSPRDGAVTNYRSAIGERLSPAVESIEQLSAAPQQMVMPELVGMSLRKSLRILQRAGVAITVEGTGRVVSHQPPTGSTVPVGATITLHLEPDQTGANVSERTQSAVP